MRTNSLCKESIYVHDIYIIAVAHVLDKLYVERLLNITDKTIFNFFNEKDLS